MYRRESQPLLALLDSGVSSDHECWRFTSQIAGCSFTGGDYRIDALGHGNTMASVLAVMQRNYPLPVVMAIGQVVDANHVSTGDELADAIEWAVRLAVDVIAIPLGTPVCSSRLRDAAAFAASNSVAIMAAVGNPCLNQTGPLYPAALPAVCSVGDSLFSSTYESWDRRPDVIVQGVPFDSGTSGATIVAAYRYMKNTCTLGGV